MSTESPHRGGPFDAACPRDPHPVFRDLRERCPVRHTELPDGTHAWLVLEHELVRSGLADPALSLDKANSRDGYTGFRLPPALDRNLLNMDPPDHTRIRALVAGEFTPRRVAAMRPLVTRIAEGLLDRFPAQGPVDLVTAFTAPLPVLVICELLGVRGADTAAMRGWMESLFVPDPDDPAAAGRSVAAMVRFLADAVAERRRAPGDDLLSALVTARDGEDRLTEDELTSLAFAMFFAGFENTVHAIGNGVHALLDHPEQLAALRADPGLVPAAVEEVLRYEPPAQFAIRRFPLRDLDVAGVAVPAGQTVLLGVSAANRDPAVFSDPDEFDIHRDDAGRHLTFGRGPHFCVGAALARLEMEIAFITLFQRFPDLRLAVAEEELVWRPSHRSRGLAALPVLF
ncbi:cytochrome P450 family protein [Actinoalloteichus caeruleus]|uniref:cytochrome P450 family protein n=1 Tax=Actinoalloteichus cyanogriseus TaxID=2893586 RepID=UPI0004AA4B55|nr:cytochrome P450 [Actinoalloteichus caeruleus]